MPQPCQSLMRRAVTLFVVMLVCSGSIAQARQGEPPHALLYTPTHVVPRLQLPAIDAAARRLSVHTEQAQRIGVHSKRLRSADLYPVDIDPLHEGSWRVLGDGSMLWHLYVDVPGATDLRLGFSAAQLPPGAHLHVIAADGQYEGPYGGEDLTAGQLWIPALPGDSMLLEVRLPAAVDPEDLGLSLRHVGAGFQNLFGEPRHSTGPETAQACNVNVVCPQAQPYAAQTRAVAMYEFTVTQGDDPGTYICTGTLMNNSALDGRPLFLTAAHCAGTSSEAASVTVFWNYRSTSCSTTQGYRLVDNQTGARLRMVRSDTDVSLLELSQMPDPAWQLHHAGWDAQVGTPPAGTAGLHHPNGDVQKITLGPQPSLVPNCIDPSSRAQTHLQTGPYQLGTTEGGSSGSALLVADGNDAQHKLVIGTLSGGNASCRRGSPPKPDAGIDCYGRLAMSWHGTNAGERLKDWLDPLDQGQRWLAGRDAADFPPVEPKLPGPLRTRDAARQRALYLHGHGGHRVPRPFRQPARP